MMIVHVITDTDIIPRVIKKMYSTLIPLILQILICQIVPAITRSKMNSLDKSTNL